MVAGAAPVIFAPWVPALRGETEISPEVEARVARVTRQVSRALIEVGGAEGTER
ncbi:hypothetical protein W824_14990 [Clavibacter cf. michiganensis LMG 26808]|nr:hypothetical protein W824_14990 [Clavibacter cf. michiganensis LMG 26808]